jgi:hypothetical protein
MAAHCRYLGGTAAYAWYPPVREARPAPRLVLNCPECGESMIYVRSDGDTHFYRCVNHPVVVFPPDGRIRVDDLYNSLIRH